MKHQIREKNIFFKAFQFQVVHQAHETHNRDVFIVFYYYYYYYYRYYYIVIITRTHVARNRTSQYSGSWGASFWFFQLTGVRCVLVCNDPTATLGGTPI